MTDDDKLKRLDLREQLSWDVIDHCAHDLVLWNLEVIERCQRIRASLQKVQCGGEGCLCKPLIDLWKNEPDLVDTESTGSSLPNSGWSLT